MASNITNKKPAIWKKRILIPFWIIRICLMIFFIVVYGIAIKELRDDPTLRHATAWASVVVFLLFTIGVLLIDVLAILLFLQDTLHPGSFLGMNCCQTGFWFAIVVINAYGVARQGTSAAGLGFVIFVFFTFVALLIYSIIIYRKQKKEIQRGNYVPAHNPAAASEQGQHQHPPTYKNAGPYYQENTSYGGMAAPSEQGQQYPYKNDRPHYQENTSYGSPVQPVELHTTESNPYGDASNYYYEAPTKPHQVV